MDEKEKQQTNNTQPQPQTPSNVYGTLQEAQQNTKEGAQIIKEAKDGFHVLSRIKG